MYARTLEIELHITDNLYSYIVSKIKESSFGARPVKRMVKKIIEDYLSEKILIGEIKEKSKVILDIKNSKVYHKTDSSDINQEKNLQIL